MRCGLVTKTMVIKCESLNLIYYSLYILAGRLSGIRFLLFGTLNGWDKPRTPISYYIVRFLTSHTKFLINGQNNNNNNKMNHISLWIIRVQRFIFCTIYIYTLYIQQLYKYIPLCAYNEIRHENFRSIGTGIHVSIF